MNNAPALFYDGRSPRARPVRLRIAEGRLHADPAEPIEQDHDHDPDPGGADPALPRSWPLDGLRWPERQRHGPRRMDLPDGTSVQSTDPPSWDVLALQAGQRDSPVVRLQQSWRGVLVALLLVVGALAGLQRWGVPALARGITALLPVSVDQSLGTHTLETLDGQLFKPSRIDAAEQARLQALLAEVLAGKPVDKHVDQHVDTPVPRLLLRDVGAQANAWALPDGSIVLSDEMVRLIAHDTPAAAQRALWIGLLGHERGHVTHRHGLTMLVQASLTTALGTLVFGDLSGLLASAPLLLGQLAWSREAEREADAAALAQLRAHGLDGEPMARLLERLQAHADETARRGDAQGDARGPAAWLLSSHPDTAERIAWFRQPR